MRLRPSLGHLVLVLALALNWMPRAAHADTLAFQEWSIRHPRLGDPPSPLVVQQRYRFTSSTEDEIIRTKYWPMVHGNYLVYDGREVAVDLAAGWSEFWDAFPSFDRSTVVLFRRRRIDGFNQIQEIRVMGGCVRITGVKGSEVHWTRDGRHLVTVTYPSPETGMRGGMYYYDLQRCRLSEERPFTEYAPLREAVDQLLVSAESTDDETWQVDLETR